jgi:hypothetical protein
VAISFDEVKALKDELAREYGQRKSEQHDLRDFYHGRFWEKADRGDASSLGQLFKDLRGSGNEVGPDLKLVHNLLQEVVTRFQTYLSPLPMIRVYTDPPESNTRRAQATRKERFLYAQWWAGGMNQVLNKAAWYLPLMGDCFLGALPDFDTKNVTPILRSPEYAYPVPGFERGNSSAIIFCWEVDERWAAREFPNYTPSGSRKARTVEIIEWSDRNEYSRWVDGQRVNGVEHNLGTNLFHQMKFIDVPDEPWGHGAVEQAVGMVEMGNALYSLMFQAVLENVFPRLILINPHKFPEEIDNGPGAVIGVNEGGDAKWLHPPTQLLPSQQQFLLGNDQAVKEATFLPDVSRGQFNASIVTGKAINELQGAGTGSVVEMVQGVGMGTVITRWNELAITLAQRLFRDDDITLYGHTSAGALEIKGKPFAGKIKGSELIGSPRNEVVFSPYIGQHEKLVMGLQGLQAQLVSKKHVRENLGIPDSTAMDEEIVQEAVDAAVLGAVLGSFNPENPDQTVQAGTDYLNALPSGAPVGAPPALLGIGAPPAPAGGVAPTPASLPAAPPGQAPAPPSGDAGAGAGEILLDQAVAAFQNVQAQGRVFLVGEIVAEGKTAEEVEVAVTDPADRQTIAAAVPFETAFTVVEDVPDEKYVEVTPGSQPLPGGAEPELEALAV